MRHAVPFHLVIVPPPAGRSPREYLVEELRTALLAGEIRANEPLPSSRVFAEAMGVSRGTVVSVYEELAGEGYVVSVPGSGTFVAEDLPRPDLAAAPTPARSASGRRGRGVPRHQSPNPHSRQAYAAPPHSRQANATPASGRDVAAVRAVVNLSPGSPSTRFGENREWISAWRDAVRHDLPSLPPPDGGDPELRKSIAAHLRMARGVRCDVEDVVVTAGTSDGLGLLLHGLRAAGAPGLRIATENPGYPTARKVIDRLGAIPVPISVREGGMDLAELGRAPGPFAAALLTPSHQYPLGGRLPVAARLALLEWARKADAVIIEDDYDSEFRHGAPSLPAIASLDTEGRVVLIGSFSKILTPWLRCGYLVIPDPELRARVLEVRATLGQPVSGFVQSALAEFLRSGGLKRHLVRVGREYRHRRSLVIAAAAELGPNVRLDAVEGGLHATLSWTTGRTDAEVVAALAARGVGLAALSAYYHRDTRPGRRGIVFGYGAPSDLELRTALAAITEVLNS
ncbi:PLP-dependent aminotransferase family protein [Brevibacterium sp.]|uniref:MocR-like pyridoxine biosynthesis transcription factor PdxR n=1 Tax=Brevibacterium sp. TaxID=1701 RepID=UPI00281223BE|nr:PLP-dependent aminotransferase family protein [Brevibacterium sp.]